MKLDFVYDREDQTQDEWVQDSKTNLVSGYVAALAFNQLCQFIGGRWPDAELQNEAPLAYNMFMQLFGAIPNE